MALVYVRPQPPFASQDRQRLDNKSRRACACGQIWMKIFRHCRPGTLLFLLLFPLFPPSFFALFFYLISLANGNFLGRATVEGIVVVTKRNGENPCVRTSVFFLSLSFFSLNCLQPSSFQSPGGKR